MRSKRSKISSLRSLGHVDNDREEGIEQIYSAGSHAAVPVQYATYGDTSSDKGTANGVGQLSGVQQQTAAIRSATTMSPEGVQKTTSSPLQAKLETAHMQPNNVTQFQYDVVANQPAVPLQNLKMDFEEIDSLLVTVATDILTGIRENRKDILKVAKELGGDKLVKELGATMTSLNRSSNFRKDILALDNLGNLLEATDYLRISYDLQHGKFDSRQIAELIYDKIADKILDKFGVTFPIFKIPIVRTVMKKGGIIVGDYLGQLSDKLVDKLLTGSKLEAYIKQKAKEYPKVVNALRKLSGK